MLTEIYEIQAFAEAVTRYARTDDGKKFVVSFEDTKSPCTSIDGNTVRIILPKLNAKLTDADATKLRWYIIHEIAHHTEGPDLFKIAEENALDPSKSPLAGLLNAFEDARIEKSQAHKFRGDAMVLSEAFGDLLKQEVERGSIARIPADNKELTNFAGALLADVDSRTDWNHGAAMYAQKLINSAPEHVKQAYEKLKTNGVVEALKNLKDEYDSFELAKKAYELLYEKSAEEHIEQQKQQREQEGEGNDGNQKKGGKNGRGESAGGKPGEGKGQKGKSAGSKEAGEGDGEEQEGMTDTGGTVDYTEWLRSNHGETQGGSGTGIHLDYSNYTAKHYRDNPYEPCPLNEIMVAWWNKGKFEPRTMRTRAEGHGSSYVKQVRDDIHRRHGVPGKGFGNKVRRLLQIKSQARYIGGAKKGRVHRKNLFRAAVPQVGNGEWNAKVFKEKYKSDVLDVAVTVLTDFSGSMSGQKAAHAVDSAVLLHDSISKSLHVPLEILAFTEVNYRTVIGVAKEFDERVAADKVAENLIETGAFMSQNADGDAILWAYRRLKGRKEKRKILIVLSDGSPASSRPGDCMGFTQEVVKEIEGEGIVEIFGIGIMDRNVKLIYSNNETIDKASELEQAVLNVIKRKIIP